MTLGVISLTTHEYKGYNKKLYVYQCQINCTSSLVSSYLTSYNVPANFRSYLSINASGYYGR